MQVIRDRLTEKEKKKVEKILSGEHSSKFIGEGATAVVQSFDRKRVIRIQTHSPDYPAENYLPWVQYCLASRSKHVPQFSYVAYRTGNNGRVMQVVSVMEKLHSADEVFGWSGGDDLDYAAYAMESYLMGAGWDEVKEDFPPLLKTAFPRRSAYSMRRTLRRKNVHMNDLHGGNWMVRKSDKRLVITDPIC